MEIKLAESEAELLEILNLQYENHIDNVPVESKKTNGFVTVRHNLDLLRKMNHKAKQVIAVDNGKVVGYALVLIKEFRDLIPALVPMFDTFERVEYQGVKLSDHNYYTMGQICVADSHQGKGIVKGLYQKHKEVYSSKFELCLTEVSSSNPRSMKAHEKVGFETIYTFRDESDEWNILSWNFD